MKFNLSSIIEKKQINKIKSVISEKDKTHIIEKANELLNQTFVFNKTWDMERCLTPYTFKVMDWNAQRNDDEEWCFMLARMDYLNYLVLASIITDNKIYAKKAKFYIMDFIEKHEKIVPSPSTRTLDTGIRIFNIFEALQYLYYLNEIDENEQNIIYQSIINQITYLKKNYLTKYKTSNWGSIQTCAIVSILPFLTSNTYNDEIYIWAKKELELQFNIQVYSDGMHWEQSTMYHVEVLNYAMKAIYYLKLAKKNIPEVLYSKAEDLANALFLQLTPTYNIETFGDTDRVYAVDVFEKAAIIFKNPKFKYITDENLDIETIYTFGACAYKLISKIEKIKPEQLYYDGNDSGMYVVRSEWDKTASFTMFTNGSLGSGHGHSDNLHFSLYHMSNEILIDSGRYTYREDHPLRTYLKSMQAHNSVIIDNNEYCCPSDSWGYSDFGIPLKNYTKHINNIHYFEGSIIGHNPLQIITRKLVVISPDIWVVCDELKCDGKHEAISYFHFDPMCDVDLNKMTVKNKNSTLKFKITGETNLQNRPCSLEYNKEVSHFVLNVTNKFEDTANIMTMFFDEKIKAEIVNTYQDANTITDKNVASAVKFNIGQNESYTVALYHKEIYTGKKILSCEGVFYHAKCVVIHEKNKVKNLFILKA